MSLFKGFTGLARIIRTNGTTFGFRFLNCDISVNQDVNVYLPSYGGSGLYRIISPKCGDISGKISLILSQNLANALYTIAKNIETVSIEISYKNGVSKYFTGVVFSQFGFSCKAGELVQVNIDLMALTQAPGTSTLSWTGTSKLVTWDKASFSGVLSSTDYPNVIAQSFSYNIENNIVVNRTAASLFPYYFGQGIQKISGNITWFDVINAPRFSTSASKNSIVINTSTFYIDDLTVTQKIAHHWTYRAPLSPELVVTTLEWTAVSDLVEYLPP